MGNNVAKTQIDSAINESMAVFNSSNDNCKVSSDQQVNLNFTQNCGYTNVISGININQTAGINSDCVQKSKTNTSQSSQVTNAFTQAAKAIKAGLSLGSQEASDVTRTSINMAKTVTNLSSKSCGLNTDQIVNFNATQGATNQCFDIDKNTGTYKWPSSNTIIGIDINQASSGRLKCVQTSDDVTTQKSQIEQTISQKATAVSIGFLGLIIAGVIAAAIAFEVSGWKMVVAIIVIVLIALGVLIGVAYLQNWWPFPRKNKPDNRENPYDFPENYGTPEEKSDVCQIAYNYLKGAQSGWDHVNETVFPNLKSSFSGYAGYADTASTFLNKTCAGNFLPIPWTSNYQKASSRLAPPSKQITRPSYPMCSCACNACYANSTLSTADTDQVCEAVCHFGYCSPNGTNTGGWKDDSNYIVDQTTQLCTPKS